MGSGSTMRIRIKYANLDPHQMKQILSTDNRTKPKFGEIRLKNSYLEEEQSIASIYQPGTYTAGISNTPVPVNSVQSL